jgi:hypothetical protein
VLGCAGGVWLSSAHASASVAAANGCDPIDPSLCLFPWPNDYFTRPDRSTATGLRLHINPLATPRNKSGVPIDPTDWNRLDGFSPGSIIVTHVPGVDNPSAFAKTGAPTNTTIWRSLKKNSPVVVIDASTGKRWPVWAEIDRSDDLNGNPPPAAETALMIHPARNLAEGTIGARLREPVVDPGRYPGRRPYWDIPRIASFPFTGRAAMVVGDLGPLRPCPNDGVTACEGSQAGTPPPPRDNNANTKGVDPHGPDWASFPEGEAAIGAWLRPGGRLPAVCGAHPCYMAGWTGPS